MKKLADDLAALVNARKQAHVSQFEIAKKAGTYQYRVSQFELGKSMSEKERDAIKSAYSHVYEFPKIKQGPGADSPKMKPGKARAKRRTIDRGMPRATVSMM